MSDFSMNEIGSINASHGAFFSDKSQHAEYSSFAFERGFKYALALGLTFWCVVGFLIWG